MKKIACLFIIAFLLTLSAGAQAKKWKEMDEFHAVMSETYHPAEEGKLDPIKKRSGEMAGKAAAWSRSEAPEGFDKKAIKKSLKKLAKETKKLDKLVKSNADDQAIKEKLNALHDLFHSIEERSEK